MPKSCNAKRSGDLLVSISPFNFLKFKMSFMGTGTSEFEKDFEFKDLKNNDEYKMIWRTNVFVGEHWLLGKFKISLNEKIESKGILHDIEKIDGKTRAINTNNFFFKFNFPRVMNLLFQNEDPITNSSFVYDIPPTLDSVFKLNEKSKKSKFYVKGIGRVTLKFNYCDVTLYPERNILAEVVKVIKTSKSGYSITMKYSNLLKENIKACYFTVIHDDGISIKNDYGFKSLKGEESFLNEFEVYYSGEKKVVELPIYGGVFKPKISRGSSSQTIKLIFE